MPRVSFAPLTAPGRSPTVNDLQPTAPQGEIPERARGRRSLMATRWALLPLAMLLIFCPWAAAQEAPVRTPSGSILRSFETPYYILHTDLGEADAREADLR